MRVKIIVLMLLVSLGAFAQTRLDYFLIQAGKCRMNGEWSKAIELYNHCLEIDPNSAEALYQLGRTKFYMRQDSLGIVMLDRSTNLDKGNPYYLEALTALYLRTGDETKALPLLEKMSRLQPKRTDLLSNLSSLYSKLDRTDDAIKTLDRWETIEGKTAELSYEKFSLYMEKGDSVHAFRELQSLCDEYPADMGYRIRLAYQYQLRGNYKKAMSIYDEVRKVDPQNISLQLAMLEYYDKNNMDSMYVHTRDSILFAPETDKQYRALLMQDIVQNTESDSTGCQYVKDMFEKVLDVDSTDVDMYTLYAAFLNYREQPDEEICSVMQRVLSQEPDNEMATQWLLQYYAGKKNFASLEEICRRGTNYHPEELAYAYFLGMTLLENDKNQEAIDVLAKGLKQRSVESRPTLVSDVFNLEGDLYFKQNERRNAFLAYDSALVYNKDNVLVMNNYAYYLSLEDDKLDKAEEMSYRTIKAEPQNKTYLDTYAWILFMQKRFPEAKNYIDQVVPPDSCDSVILAEEDISGVVVEHAGDIYWMNGYRERAAQLWNLALKKNDEDATAALKKKAKKGKYVK